MDAETTRVGHGLAIAALAVALSALPGVVWAVDPDADWDAADTESGEIDDHESSSENPDDMTVGSQDPAKMVVGSQSMESHEAGSENPDNMVTGAGTTSAHEGNSEDLTNLPDAKPEAGYVPIEVPGQSDWEPTTNAAVLLARQKLLRAEKRARAAITTYGDMMEQNYPRGQARIRIVNERDAAMKALEEAKQQLREAENNS